MLTPSEQHEVQLLDEVMEREYDREVAFASNYLLQIREEKRNGMHDSASSTEVATGTLAPVQARPYLRSVTFAAIGNIAV